MAAPSASLILGAVALAAAVYVYVLMQRMQKSMDSTQENMRTIATHLEDEVHPAVETLRQQQGELFSMLSTPYEASPLASQEGAIAQAMLRSMLDVSLRPAESDDLGADIESIQSDEYDAEEGDADGGEHSGEYEQEPSNG